MAEEAYIAYLQKILTENHIPFKQIEEFSTQNQPNVE